MSRRAVVGFGHAVWALSVGLSSSAFGSIWYVDAAARPGGSGTSWADAFDDLQDSLAVATSGDQVWVVEGTYTPDSRSGDRTRTYQLPGGVGVYGGFAGGEQVLEERDPALHVTVLSGDLSGNDVPGAGYFDLSLNDNSYHVVSVAAGAIDIVLDGFTIRSGHADTPPGFSNGGGLENAGGSPIVAGCVFSFNSAGNAGGAVHNAGGAAHFTACTFLGNFGGDGAAVHNDTGSSPTYDGCLFVDTAAFTTTVSNFQSQATFIDCGFSGNSDPYGFPRPVIYNVEGSVTVTGCSFVGNSGRAIRNSAGTPIIEDCTFLNNGPDGAVSIEYFCTAFISGCTFDSNYGLGVEVGGGAWADSNGSPLMFDCLFFGNSSAHEGGAFRGRFSNPTFINCRFIFNAADLGGAIYNQYSDPLLVNCLFIDNFADSDGGAFCNFGEFGPALPVFSNCTFTGNVAGNRGGGVFSLAIGQFSRPTLTSCVLWGNLAGAATGEPAQVALLGGSTVDLDYSCVEGLTGALGGEGNIGDDPLLDGEGRPSAGSPCIDAGSSPGVAHDLLDVDDDGDVYEPTPIDLDGNPRLADDLDTPDRGCGGGVVVDMGAYEFPGVVIDFIAGDLDGDGQVGIADLLAVLGAWGLCGECCPADLDGNGVVGIVDLMVVLAAWSGR